MNWRRGLLLAVLHLSLAMSLVTWQEYQYWASSHSESNLLLRPVVQEGVEWDKPATICYWTTAQEEIVRYVNLPASILSGWHYPPHVAFTVAGLSEALFGKVSRGSVLTTAIGFVVLIFAQWILIGAAPVIRPKRVWLDPTVLISFLAAVSTFLLVVSPGLPGFYYVPLLFVIALWLLWFGIACSKMLCFGWRFLRRKPAG